MNDRLVIRGAREHNLRNIDLDLPKDSLVVISGLSGSGKSSLAFDTIFAEGQRRYIESLSSYARMFLGRMEKPDVDSIEGLSPAISIEQKSTNRNPRSTVGTVTEIYDYYRLLWARIGHRHCPKCGREITEMSVDQIIDLIFSHPEGGKLMILAPVARGKKGEFRAVLEDSLRLGYLKAEIDGRVYSLDEGIPQLEKKIKRGELCAKFSAVLPEGGAEALLAGRPDFLLESDEPLFAEFYAKLRGGPLRPSAAVSYSREAFVYAPGGVRVNIDRDLRRCLDAREFLNPRRFGVPADGGFDLLEVKYGAFLPDVARMAVQTAACWRSAFSKYAECRRFE